MQVYSPQIMKDAENYLFSQCGVSALGLMKKAADRMSFLVRDYIKKGGKTVVLCGKGNNAGDGYELAGILISEGYDVTCIDALDSLPVTDIAKICCDRYTALGGKICSSDDLCREQLLQADVIVDAVFGIGFDGVIKRDTKLFNLIETANSCSAVKIALDVPSGVNSHDGSMGGIAFKADVTLTVSGYKIGMLSYPAKDYCGKTEIIDIGISSKLLDSYEKNFIVPHMDYVKKALPPRPEFSNKGDFGKLLMVCGSEYMTGAAVMAAESALRSGAGLVTVASEKAVLDVLKVRLCEPVYKPLEWQNEQSTDDLLSELDRYSTLLIGCGLGIGDEKKSFILQAIKSYKGQIIIDADGINMLSGNINVLKEAQRPVIITPHPGEFSRISGLDTESINSDRINCAVKFSEEFRCITVLKGAGTVTASPDGRFAVNVSGNAGLAKGGSGDVLAGLIAGLAANPMVSPFDAAVCGVYLHGLAADELKKKYSEYGLLPSELSKEFARLLP